MQAREFLARLARLPPSERDAVCEELLGIREQPSVAPPGEHLIGYHASGVAAIVRLLLEVPVVEDDVVIDLGSGLGKVVLLAKLLTGATARGVELQEALAARARLAAVSCGLDVRFVCADARHAPLDDGTVFFLYLPFTGLVLLEVLARLRAVATRHAIVVCTLGLDLAREAPWLVRRDVESFWLDIYDSAEPKVARRATRARAPGFARDAEIVAHERPAVEPL
ncbi:MAG TPA: class I SAM-dependent methyltransferase [Polyangiaceae bacterium]|jgi:SAM-dependent methyltransferase